MKYIDIHGHINFPEYDADREEVIKRAHEAGVGIIVVGTDLESSKKCVELAEKHEEMWAIVGMHPTEATPIVEVHSSKRVDLRKSMSERVTFDVEAFQTLAMNPKVVAIGECGLDFFHSKLEDVAYQKEVFIKHIEVANSVNKPLMLHVRNSHSSTNAYQEALAILKDYAKVPANFHFFAGKMQDMKDVFDAWCSISFTGVVTFAHHYDELVRSAPLEKIMTETDCPFVAPLSHRGLSLIHISEPTRLGISRMPSSA